MIGRNMARSKISSETWAQALALAAEHGAPYASKQTGISSATIRRRMSRLGLTRDRAETTAKATAALTASVAERKAKLAIRFVDLAEMAAERAAELIAQASLRDVVGAWDYSIKNAQLLTGQATSRVEHRDSFDVEVEALAAEFENV